MYVCMYVCVCMYVYMYVCVCTYACVYVVMLRCPLYGRCGCNVSEAFIKGPYFGYCLGTFRAIYFSVFPIIMTMLIIQSVQFSQIY